MRTLRALVFLLAFCTCVGSAQPIGVWKNYTCMKNVNAVAGTGTTYWAATTGGLFGWQTGTNTFVKLTNADGLPSLALTGVAVDNEGVVWSGSSDGYLSAYSPDTRSLRILSDFHPGEGINQISSLSLAGDTLFVCTNFGVSVFRRSRFEFADTYSHFGSIPISTKIAVSAAIIAGDRIWVAITDQSSLNVVASAPLDGRPLLAPDSWTLEPVSTPQSPITSLAAMGGKIYAGTTAGLGVRDGSGWSMVPAFQGRSVKGLTATTDHLLLLSALGEVFSVDAAGAYQQIGPAISSPPTSIITDPQGNPVVGSLGGGIQTLGTSWGSHYPDGPNSNEFISVTVDQNGVVWGASGASTGYGMYRFDGASWTSYTAANSVLPMDQVYRVSACANGSVWGSTWGAGSVEFPGGGVGLDTAHVFNSNVGMVGIAGSLKYVVTANAVSDGQGNTWLSILASANGNTLAVRNANNQWKLMSLVDPHSQKVTEVGSSSVDKVLAVDGNDNLWIVTNNGGILGLNNAGSIDSVADFLLGSTNGLPSNKITTIVIDRENTMWVGTDKGIGIVSDLTSPLSSGSILAYQPLPQTYINTIAVDPIDQKWVGTPTGVIVLSPDGTEKVAEYNILNTNGQLPSNNVHSMAIDPHSGTVYFGTSSGLVTLTTAFAEPAESPSHLNVYPNPFRVPATVPLTINGLGRNSQVKILSADGSLIRVLSTPGGRIGFWDGCNAKGDAVASGVYFIVGFTEDGSAVTGKVAVLRR